MAKKRFILSTFKFSVGLAIAFAHSTAAIAQSLRTAPGYYMVGNWRVERVLFSNGKLAYCQVTRDFSSNNSLRFTQARKSSVFKYQFRGAPFPPSGNSFPVTFWVGERTSVETGTAQFVENKRWASITERNQDEPGLSSDALLNGKTFTIEHIMTQRGGEVIQWTYSLAGSKSALEELTECSLDKPPEFG